MNDNLIVLIPGWGKPSFAYKFLEAMFQEENFDVLVADYPHRGLTPIQYSAKHVASQIGEFTGHYDHVCIIGHSMGGLIGRYIVQKYPDLVDSYVSIATPHQGTRWASLAPWSKSASQMKIGSPFLERLNSLDWPQNIPVLNICAGWEEIVYPRRNAKIPGKENIIIPKSTHASLIFNPRTFWEIYSWLVCDVLEDEEEEAQPEIRECRLHKS